MRRRYHWGVSSHTSRYPDPVVGVDEWGGSETVVDIVCVYRRGQYIVQNAWAPLLGEITAPRPKTVDMMSESQTAKTELVLFCQ